MRILTGPAVLAAVSLFTLLSGSPSAAQQPSAGALSSGIGLFAASDGEAGLELWRSDGTPAGTFRLTDDACNEYCEQFNLLYTPWVEAGRRAFVLAQTGFQESTLWVTDGSRSGTVPLYQGTKIRTLEPPAWVPRLGLLFFVVNDDSTNSYDLWRSDGTVHGTRKVRTFLSADTRGGVRELTAFQDRVFFNGQDPAHGPALWSSDGTETGTVLVREFFRDSERNGPSWLRALGSRLLFVAPGPSSGSLLWASDGTPAGTQPIYTLQVGQNNYETIYDARVVGGALFFSTTLRLWISNGKRSGTRPLATFSEPPLLSGSSLVKGRYYFQASTGTSGREIWGTDGTPAGTRMLADVCPGSCSGVFEPWVLEAGDNLLFPANDGLHGSKLWRSDGMAQGTRVVTDAISTPSPARIAAGQILVPAYTSSGGVHQLWRTNGTSPGTVPLTDLLPGSFIAEPTLRLPGTLLFRVTDETGGDALWVSDGTRPGTRLVRTFSAGGAGSAGR